MPSNEGFIFSYKGQGGYIPLYPKTVKEQVIDLTVQETGIQVFGPTQVTLKKENWANNSQVVPLNGVLPTDIVMCTKVLFGTEEEMIEQDRAFNCLDPYKGIESYTDVALFACNQVPTVDLTVSLSWMR